MNQPKWKKKSHWSSFRTPAGGKSPSRNASPSPLAFRSKSLTLSSLVSWPTSLQCTQRTVLARKYNSLFWSWSQPFSTTYRLISSFHSNGVLLSLGTGRKRVILSVAGWSKIRTQHTSPGLDHWPAKHRARRQLSAGNRAAMIRGCGKTTWPLHKVALSCRRSSRLAKAVCGVDFNPTDRWSTEAWRHGGKNRFHHHESYNNQLGHAFVSENTRVAKCAEHSSPKD